MAENKDSKTATSTVGRGYKQKTKQHLPHLSISSKFLFTKLLNPALYGKATERQGIESASFMIFGQGMHSVHSIGLSRFGGVKAEFLISHARKGTS